MEERNDLIDRRFIHYDEAGRALIRKAYAVAAAALKEELRDSGRPFIEHPLQVASILADEIGLQADAVAALFLHEATRKQNLVLPPEEFGEEILTVVDGLNKISTIKPKDTRLEAENYRRLIIQYSTDPRVVVIKLADRLEIMRSIGSLPKLTRERKLLETLLLYIPIAHQLGLYRLKSEMEDIYFRYAEPEEYRLITNKLKATEKDREQLTEEFIGPLQRKLREAGIRYRLKVRTKTAYSIFKKMQRQKVPFEGVYDVFALRFIIGCDGDLAEEKRLCWAVYSYVTEEYEPDTSRLRDWITTPKSNGYESLHITVKNREGAYLEVQIRTERMDDIAENGHAAHWAYKGISREQNLDEWLKTVRRNLEQPQAVRPEDLPQPPSREIFVFTPTGELRILSAGATLLDFAFLIHSNLGLRCTGGKINGKAVSLREKLKTGDAVEILTGKNQKPSSDWLSFAVTSKARTKIKQALREAEFKKAAEGKELLARRLKNWKLSFPDDLMAEFMKKYRYSGVNSLYAEIGDGLMDLNLIKSYLLEQERAVRDAAAAEPAETAREEWKSGNARAGDDLIVINAEDLKGLDYKMAKCCNPVYGDEVFGFVTRNDGIKIHRLSCPNAARLMEKYAYRIHKVRWAETPSTGSFQVGLRISAQMEASVINEIMDIIGDFRASLRTFHLSEDAVHGLYHISLKISVPSHTELDKVLSQLRQHRHILRVSRN